MMSSIQAIPHLNLGVTVLAILLICLGLVLLRGIAKIIVGSAILAASAWIALVTWQISPALCYELLGKSDGFLVFTPPILAFGLSFWLLVKALRFILTPFEMFQSGERPKTSLFSGLLVALVPTFVLFLITASLIHHFGTVEEVRSFALSSSTTATPSSRGYIKNFKQSIDSIVPDSWLRKLDPLTDPDRVQTAKLVTRRTQQEPAPVIDPETGQPYPRAIIVDDPELQNLVRQNKFGALLRHPILTKATQDPIVQKLLRHLNSQ